MIKAAGEQAVDWLTSIYNRIVKVEAIPESWQMSELVPICKGKGGCAGMQLISRHQATRTWNEGSRKSSREKVEAVSRDRQDAVCLDQVQEQLMQYLLQDSYKRDIEENTGNCGGHL